ncbi:hypothetical protein M0805_007929 [Coniferiporia weirii]|nr:hypothetical protein M0805_007929 [Coniferiporia weirii]
MQRTPTIDDLRVKLCYICREEELHNGPAQPARRWVHPCKCTLVAHERCLLDWIRASENNPDKASASILKCPQCSHRYELESHNPLVLKIMDHVKALLSCAGMTVTVLTAGSAVACVGAGVYVLLTGYGVYALDHFVGREMLLLLLGDGYEQWPFHAFINLPLIPLGLVFSQTKRFRDKVPLLSLMMLWPSIPPLRGAPLPTDYASPGQPTGMARWILSLMGLGIDHNKLPLRIRPPAYAGAILKETARDLLYSWPPSPPMFSFGLHIVRNLYGMSIQSLHRSVLGDTPVDDEEEARRGGPRQLVVQNFRMEMRIEDEGPVPANNQPDQLRDDNNVRLVLDDNNVRLVLDDDDDGPNWAEQLPPVAPPVQEFEIINAPQADNVLAGRARREPPANANQAQNGNGNGNGNDIGDNGDRARVRLRATGGALGGLIGKALLIPPMASFAGSILLRLALPAVPYAHYRVDIDTPLHPPYTWRQQLCRFLAIRPPNTGPRISIWEMYRMPGGLSTFGRARVTLALATRILVVGTPTWRESDPVWWRTTLGLGICFVAKDLMSIWYQYLSQREIRSRRLKDRPFDGIDPQELDLKPEVLGTFR